MAATRKARGMRAGWTAGWGASGLRRLGGGPQGRRRLFGVRLAVEECLQLLAHLEVRDLLGRDVHLLARLGVAALAGSAVAETEAPEAPDLHLVAALQGVHDAAERGLDDDPRLDLRDVELLGDDVDEVRLGHGVPGGVRFGHRGRSRFRAESSPQILRSQGYAGGCEHRRAGRAN